MGRDILLYIEVGREGWVVYTNKDFKFSTQGGMEILVPMGSRVETNKLKSHGRVLPEDTMEIKPEGGEI